MSELSTRERGPSVLDLSTITVTFPANVVLTDLAQTISTTKTFTSVQEFNAGLNVTSSAALRLVPFGTSAGNTTEIRFLELAANGSNYVGFKARDALAGNVIWLLPPADGTVDQAIVTDGALGLTFKTIGTSMANQTVSAQAATFTAATTATTYLLTGNTTDQIVNLPTAVGNSGLWYSFIKTEDAAANTTHKWTIDPASTETVDGDTTYILSAQDSSVSIVSDGSNWRIISERVLDACRIYHSAVQTIANNTLTASAFDSEHSDRGGLHNTSTNNTRITFQRPGRYRIIGQANWVTNTNGVRYLYIRLNGATQLASVTEDGDGTAEQNLSTEYVFAAGDYIELVGQQTSGGDLGFEVLANNRAPAYMVSYVSRR